MSFRAVNPEQYLRAVEEATKAREDLSRMMRRNATGADGKLPVPKIYRQLFRQQDGYTEAEKAFIANQKAKAEGERLYNPSLAEQQVEGIANLSAYLNRILGDKDKPEGTPVASQTSVKTEAADTSEEDTDDEFDDSFESLFDFLVDFRQTKPTQPPALTEIKIDPDDDSNGIIGRHGSIDLDSLRAGVIELYDTNDPSVPLTTDFSTGLLALLTLPIKKLNVAQNRAEIRPDMHIDILPEDFKNYMEILEYVGYYSSSKKVKWVKQNIEQAGLGIRKRKDMVEKKKE